MRPAVRCSRPSTRPSGPPERPEGRGRAERPLTLVGATVGIISNGKAGTRPFFDHLERLLREEWRVGEVVRLTKGNYSAPA